MAFGDVDLISAGLLRLQWRLSTLIDGVQKLNGERLNSMVGMGTIAYSKGRVLELPRRGLLKSPGYAGSAYRKREETMLAASMRLQLSNDMVN